MSRRKRVYSDFLVADDDEFDGGFSPLTCSQCGSDDIFTEAITSEEWAGDKSINTSVIRYTCLNEACGHYWEVKA